MGTKKGNNTIVKAMATPRTAGKLRIKGNLNPDTMLEGNARTTIATEGTGVNASFFRLDMTNTGPISTVGGLYQQYLYKPGTVYNYVPSVGLNTAGNIVVGWIDNPEVMGSYLGGNIFARTAIVTSLANAKVYPLWQAFSYAYTAPPRLKKFDTNTSTSSTVDEISRSTQGMFVWAILGGPISTTVGMPYIHQKVQLWNLGNNYLT